MGATPVGWRKVLAAAPKFSGEGRWQGDAETRPCACHLVEVSLDPETAHVTLDRVFIVQASGHVVDRVIAAGHFVDGAAQGIGEAGTTGASAAFLNAVNDALVRVGAPAVAMPATPQTVWRALQAPR
jgi:CO/xanthine dehydrogenase Mo-binding subunit